MAVLTFNGMVLKCPSAYSYEGQQTVDSARNANAQVVAQKINRRMVKLSSITWNIMYPDELKTLLDCIEEFSGILEYYDPKAGGFIKRRMYWGDYKASPYMVDKTTGEPLFYVDVSASLIDMGYPDLE